MCFLNHLTYTKIGLRTTPCKTIPKCCDKNPPPNTLLWYFIVNQKTREFNDQKFTSPWGGILCSYKDQGISEGSGVANSFISYITYAISSYCIILHAIKFYSIRIIRHFSPAFFVGSFQNCPGHWFIPSIGFCQNIATKLITSAETLGFSLLKHLSTECTSGGLMRYRPYTIQVKCLPNAIQDTELNVRVVLFQKMFRQRKSVQYSTVTKYNI